MTDQTFTDAPLIAEKFLLGDLIKFLLGEIKQLPPVSFSMLPEAQQQQIIDRLQEHTTEAVRQTVKIIAGRGITNVAGEIAGVNFKAGVVCTINVSKQDANRLALADSIGAPVLIVMPEYAAAFGGDMPKATPDQNPLPIE